MPEPYLFVGIFWWVIALLVAAAMGAICLMIAARIRRIYSIPLSPTLVETREEHVAPEVAAMLAAAAPTLERLGFVPAASAYAPQMLEGTSLRWTQVLFVHRERGDRASVMWLGFGRPTPRAQSLVPAVGFATELADGRAVRTTRKPTEPLAAYVEEEYRRHRRDVESTLGADARGILPAAGEEFQWLQQRASRIAAGLAKSNRSFVLDRRAQCYRPSWGYAVRLGFRSMTRRFRQQPRGFEAVAPDGKD